MTRASGILMHISSLPSPYGIGTLGHAAHRFGALLARAGQKYWQMLPLGPTSYGDSPYQSFSSFAGNPYFIDLDLLAEEGLLEAAEYETLAWGSDPEHVDYGLLYQNRRPVLYKAYQRGWERFPAELAAFREENAHWLHDYALYMAVKEHFENKSWVDWPEDAIRLREPAAMEHYRTLLSDSVNYHIFLQFLFYRQWEALKTHLHSLNIRIIGDVPIYVSMDSADVWASPSQFQLDEDRRPLWVAGVPPDYFSATGQLWGNPLYDWEAMEEDGFRWWIQRMQAAAKLFDVVRIDHFRGLASYWRVPAGEETAIKGSWEKGPGMALITAIQQNVKDVQIIAEDLGILTPDVFELMEDAGFPGMKILEFAFDGGEPGAYLPHNYQNNCVCYTGTHDNTTAAGWFLEASPEAVNRAAAYLGFDPDGENRHWMLIKAGLRSVAGLFIAQMQDYLGLGAEARMNTPGTPSGNWQWRMLPGAFTEELADQLAYDMWMYGRK